MFDPLSLTLTLASTAFSAFQQQRQLRAQRDAQAKALNEQAKQRWEEYEEREKKRKDALKKNLAKRRARMGAQGLSAADGSAGAIIQGQRTDHAEAQHDDFTNVKEGLDQSYSAIQKNLLESSQAINRQAAGQAFGTIYDNVLIGKDEKKDDQALAADENKEENFWERNEKTVMGMADKALDYLITR